ncbi:MAG: FAD-binding protein, partial [Planctomycetes bacterium]|nr:FAD-binding protein [Planctomycetota bacterium]
ATILASGGAGQVWRESTNPSSATGDGLAMAYRAGATLRDMAFMQFHPTTLYVAGASRSLITEAVRGEGAHLIDRNGHRFMPDYDERAELAPRDVVARAILAQMAKTGHTHVYLDARHLDGFAQRFPGIDGLLKRFDIDPAAAPIPVHPSAHYMIGGVAADTAGRTSLPGLYACGEAAATGLHGANRLASNSLLEGMVLGKATGEAAAAEISAAEGNATRSYKVVSDIPLSDRSELDLADVRSSLRSVMWRHVGIEREGERLAEVGEMFDFWARYTLDKIFDEQPGWEVQNMLTAGALVTRAAHWRAESRGTHYRADEPEPRDEFAVHDAWRRGEAGPSTVSTVDVRSASAK